MVLGFGSWVLGFGIGFGAEGLRMPCIEGGIDIFIRENVLGKQGIVNWTSRSR